MIPPVRTGILNPVALDKVDDNCPASLDNSTSAEDVEMEEEGFSIKKPSPVFISTGSGRMDNFGCAAAANTNEAKIK
jgi:hypothetical protein